MRKSLVEARRRALLARLAARPHTRTEAAAAVTETGDSTVARQLLDHPWFREVGSGGRYSVYVLSDAGRAELFRVHEPAAG